MLFGNLIVQRELQSEMVAKSALLFKPPTSGQNRFDHNSLFQCLFFKFKIVMNVNHRINHKGLLPSPLLKSDRVERRMLLKQKSLHKKPYSAFCEG